MIEEHMNAIVSVPVLSQHCRYFVLSESLLKEFWVLDIVVVGDTTILCSLLMQGGELEMRLVTISQVGAPHGVLEVRCALVVVVATSILIVESESQAQSFASIDSKYSLEVILAIRAVSAAVERYVGDR